MAPVLRFQDGAALADAAPAPGEEETLDGALPYRRLLARQLGVHCRLRFGVVGLIVVGVLVAKLVVGVAGLPVDELLGTAFGLALFNLGVRAGIQWLPRQLPDARAQAWLLALRHTTIVVDYLTLTFLVYLIGGARSPFLPAFLLHIVLGSVMVSRTAAFVYALLAVTLVNATVFGELAGVFTPVLPAGAVASSGPLDPRFAVSVAAAYTFLFVVTTWLLTSLAEAMRHVERELVARSAELARLSAARRDFLHVAVHNLRSPLAAVTMLLDSLGLGLAGALEPRQRELVDRARQRLAGSDRFLHDLGVLANLEAHELSALDQRVELGELLGRLVEEQRDLARARGQSLELERAAGPAWVRGNDRLLFEAIVNLVTNALKFTPREGRIRVGLTVTGGAARVSVADEGPGIPPERRGQLFREFSRLDTVLPDGERPPGTGLGLSIVQRIASSLGGRVEVASEVGRGSVFTLELPLAAPPPAAASAGT